MPISVARAQAHIDHWSPKLPSRTWWPSNLFFAAHVTAAAKIIESGRLICRRNLAGAIDHDIANQEALGTNPIAHDYVRLYFRPKTHFHLRTEGIKLLTDGYRLAAHMSQPIMFLFELPNVVTRPNVRFCERKMAHVNIVPGDDEAYFDTIDFSKVYHDSGITDPIARQDINDRRMAEVLVPDELPLAGTLRMIICRTNFDALSLQCLLRHHDPSWGPWLRVSTKPAEMFMCWGAYITELQFAGNVLNMKARPSRDYVAGTELKFYIRQGRPGLPPLEWKHNCALTNDTLRIAGWDPNATDDWKIEIEDALAFVGSIPVPQTTVIGGG
jgi:hypothetical protein